MAINPICSMVEKHPNLVIGKSTCPHCSSSTKYLIDNGVHFSYKDVNDAEEFVRAVMDTEGHKTFPFVYMDGKFVGGFDDLRTHWSK